MNTNWLSKVEIELFFLLIFDKFRGLLWCLYLCFIGWEHSGMSIAFDFVKDFLFALIRPYQYDFFSTAFTLTRALLFFALNLLVSLQTAFTCDRGRHWKHFRHIVFLNLFCFELRYGIFLLVFSHLLEAFSIRVDFVKSVVVVCRRLFCFVWFFWLAVIGRLNLFFFKLFALYRVIAMFRFSLFGKDLCSAWW